MFDVSNNAIKRIEEVSLKDKEKKFFRISVDGGGCQGFSYKFNFDKDMKNDDQVFEFGGIKVLIDKTSLSFIEGSQLDFVEDMIGSYFKITNPNANSTCGCGTSFSI